MKLSRRGQRWAWIAATTAACLAAAALFSLFRGGYLPFMDGHPHRLTGPGVRGLHGTTEADWEAGFGCPGRLVGGSRTPGTAYTVEWSDDTGYHRVSFGADGYWTREEGGPFFGCRQEYIPTPYEQFKLALRRMGFDAR
jgi:hypothetical protein